MLFENNDVIGVPDTVPKAARHLVNANFSVYGLYKESISKEMNNENGLNLHLHDQMSG